MALKNTAFLVLVGMVSVTILLIAGLIADVLGVVRGLIPAMRFLASFINAFVGLHVVVFPYASALALMVAPEEACLNLQRLAAGGFEGRYGLYEAIDYTPSRQPRGQSSAVVWSFMAHHQGMSLLALAYLLLDDPVQKRFESDPFF